jgi:RNA polymerase sigma-70 factor (ECF subfamily)
VAKLRGRATSKSFFRAEHTTLFRALCLVTRDRPEAEEIMQDAFLRVWERWDRISSMDDPREYLYRVAMNGFRSRYAPRPER